MPVLGTVIYFFNLSVYHQASTGSVKRSTFSNVQISTGYLSFQGPTLRHLVGIPDGVCAFIFDVSKICKCSAPLINIGFLYQVQEPNLQDIFDIVCPEWTIVRKPSSCYPGKVSQAVNWRHCH